MRSYSTETERKEHLQNIVQNELANAEGRNSDSLAANRELAMRYYKGAPRGDELADRSHVISMDVADMINGTLAMLVPMLATDAVIEFEPNGPEDEPSAKAESDAVNQLIIEDNRGFIEIQEAVKDALLFKNGCMKVEMQEAENVETLDREDGSDEELAMLDAQLPPNTEMAVEGDKIKLRTLKRVFVVKGVPIENISYTAGYSGKMAHIPFFSQMVPYTRSDLVMMGIPEAEVAALAALGDSENATAQERNVGGEIASDVNTPSNPGMEIITCYEVYVRTDMDGDGVAERYKCLFAGTDNCLTYEIFDLVPFAMGSPFINPHRLTGESLFDHLCATQDVKTAYRRQLIDNVTAINNGRYAYDPGQTNEEDVMTPKPGGGIRARNPTQSVVPIMIPDVTSGILQAMAYEDQARSERGGASLDLLSADAQLVGETAHGIERQYASREMLAAMIGRNLSETMIRDVYMLTHEFLRRWSNEPLGVTINGQYQQIDATQWPERTRLNVKTGMSPGERGHLQTVLGQHMQLQAQAMQSGMNGILADPNTLYRTSQDWLRMAGVDNPERLAINPASEQAQQAGQQQQEQQQQLQAQQQQITQLMGQLEQAKLQEDARQHDGELEHKYYATDMDANISEAKISGQGVIDLERERLSNEGKRQAAAITGAASD